VLRKSRDVVEKFSSMVRTAPRRKETVDTHREGARIRNVGTGGKRNEAHANHVLNTLHQVCGIRPSHVFGMAARRNRVMAKKVNTRFRGDRPATVGVLRQGIELAHDVSNVDSAIWTAAGD
jgi:hypothetical protein